MTREQAMIEANFNLFIGYLKLDEQKQIAKRILKEAGCSDDEISEFMGKRSRSIEQTVAASSYSPE